MVARGALLWDSWHAATERLWAGKPGRYLQIRYEEFTADPRRVVRRIVAMLGEEGASLRFISGRALYLKPNHTFSANRVRLQTGRVEVRPDLEWQEKMARRDRLLVTSLTLPMLLRYHYPLLGR